MLSRRRPYQTSRRRRRVGRGVSAVFRIRWCDEVLFGEQWHPNDPRLPSAEAHENYLPPGIVRLTVVSG